MPQIVLYLAIKTVNLKEMGRLWPQFWWFHESECLCADLLGTFLPLALFIDAMYPAVSVGPDP